MRILSHYFVARFLGLFSTVLVVAVLLLATIELVLNLDDASSFGRNDSQLQARDASTALLDTLRYLGVRLTSYYLADILPIASFVSVFVVFALSGRAMELIATAAGGIRPARIVLPVLATALILSLAAGLLHETLILRAEQIFMDEGRRGRDRGFDFSRDAFWYRMGRTITKVTRADPQTRTLHGVEIFERDEQGLVRRVIRTPEVLIDHDGVWRIQQASIWHFDPADIESQPVLEEGVTLTLDLDTLKGDRLLGADPALLPLPDLARYLKESAPHTSSARRRLENRYHERRANPWLVLLFAWMAIPFALRIDERGHYVRPAIAAVATLGLYFLIESAGRTLTLQELIPAGLTPWVPMGLFAIASALAIRRRSV